MIFKNFEENCCQLAHMYAISLHSQHWSHIFSINITYVRAVKCTTRSANDIGRINNNAGRRLDGTPEREKGGTVVCGRTKMRSGCFWGSLDAICRGKDDAEISDHNKYKGTS